MNHNRGSESVAHGLYKAEGGGRIGDTIRSVETFDGSAGLWFCEKRQSVA